VSNTKSEY